MLSDRSRTMGAPHWLALFGLILENLGLMARGIWKAAGYIDDRAIHGEVFAVGGADKGTDVVVTNTENWMGPDISVVAATRGRVRAFGRVWDFDGRSAGNCQIDWRGPR